jgi:hypothetical protein
MFHTFSFAFQMFSQTHMILTIHMCCRCDCAYGFDDHCTNPNHARLIKQKCLDDFLIKELYTWLDAIKLCFYHRTHTPNEWWTNTWPTKTWIINLHVIVCTLNFTVFKKSHLHSHYQTNLWHAQINLVGKCECQKSHDKGWFHLIIRHYVFGSETSKRELVVSQKPNHFSLILGFAWLIACIWSSRSWPN